MIELLFLASSFQCGSNAPQAEFRVEIVANGTQYNLLVNDRFKMPGVNSLSEIDSMTIVGINNASCMMSQPVSTLIKHGDPVPQVNGAYNQSSLQTILNDYLVHPYMELLPVELGTTNTSSSIYDLQDVVLVVNTKPGPDGSPITYYYQPAD